MSNNKAIKSLISVTIPKYHDKTYDKKPVTYYVLEFYNSYSKETWSLEKRYSEFDNLYKVLNKLFPKCPTIPGKSFLGMSLKNDELEKRRIQLENFMIDCVSRKDIMSNEVFREFIEVEKHSSSNDFYKHSKINEYNELPLGIRDFIYLKYDRISFVACSDMNIASRIDAYITNVNFPWEKKTDSHITVGAVFAFKTKEDPNTNEITFEKLWAKSYPIQTGVISWDNESNTLAVGLDDGKIYFYKTSPESNFMQYDSICELKPHSDRVMGIAVDAKSGYIYSASTDKKFIVSEANYQQTVTEVVVSSHGFTNLVHDRKNKRLFLSNEVGAVSVYSISNFPPTILTTVQCSDKASIRGFHIDYKKLFIFAGTMGGKLSVLELGHPGKEKFIKEIACFEGNPKIRIIRYNFKRHELITGDGNGKIVIWSLKNGSPIYAWEAHKSEITQMHYEDETRVLLSCGKDKAIRVWKLPEKWMDEEIENFERNEIKNQIDSISMINLKKKMTAMNEDSDEDDLNGWDVRDN